MYAASSTTGQQAARQSGAFGHSAIGSLELCRWFIANKEIAPLVTC
jgi:hypothetical protein